MEAKEVSNARMRKRFSNARMRKILFHCKDEEHIFLILAFVVQENQNLRDVVEAKEVSNARMR